MTASWADVELQCKGIGQVATGTVYFYEVTSRVPVGWGRYGSVLGLCGTHERWFCHIRALDTVLESRQVAVDTP